MLSLKLYRAELVSCAFVVTRRVSSSSDNVRKTSCFYLNCSDLMKEELQHLTFERLIMGTGRELFLAHLPYKIFRNCCSILMALS